jgi:SRSO17 transposase
LVQAYKKNMERMAEAVPDSNDQALQHFLTNSPWDEQLVVEQVAHDTNDLIGGRKNSCLLLDESGMPKKGKKSVGVSRQWCGQLGKTENCQVGVYSTLCSGEHFAPIGFRLYLPKRWVDDKARCKEADIPDESVEFFTKPELAIQLVIEARMFGVEFEWISADSLYGKDTTFLRMLDQMKETFMADAAKDQTIYLEDPAPTVPAPKSKKGRKPSKLKAQCEPIRVDKWAEQQPAKSWKRTRVRDTTKGKLQVNILHQRVWLWDGEEPNVHCWHLIVRRDPNGDLKYSLSNAHASTSYRRLAYMQAQRYWIERNFQEAKNQCGMGEYQARKWKSWHHHMAMVLMAMLFMLEQRMLFKDDYPLLSCFDIVCILNFLLPRRATTLEEVIRQLEERHRRRQASIDYAYHKQMLADLSKSVASF